MILIDSQLDRPIYNQLYGQLRNKIIKGEFKSGSKLPSMRMLSKELNISRNTVEMAYHQLCSDGYIFSKFRSGFYVENLDFSSIRIGSEEVESDSIEPCQETEDVVYDFKYGMLSPDHLPLRHWKRLMNDCLMESREEISEYRPLFGEYALRQEIHKYLKFYRGVECSIEQIFIGSGVHYCLSLLCQLLRADNDQVAMEEPGYHVTRSTFINHGYHINPIELDYDGLNIDELNKSSSKVVYVTSSHQYPLGMIMPVSKRIDLIKWAEKRDGLIIEDDYSCHLRYSSEPVQSLQSLSQDRVAYIGSFSKFLFPSLRIAYMIIPKSYLEKFKQSFDGYPSSVSFTMQDTLGRFMKEGHWERYLKRNRKLQKSKHDRLIHLLKETFGDKLIIYGANAGLHLLLEFPSLKNSVDLVDLALKEGVRVYPTDKFWSRDNNKSHKSVILGYGGIRLEDIEGAVEQLGVAWKDVI